jgi:hypothetical protein
MSQRFWNYSKGRKPSSPASGFHISLKPEPKWGQNGNGEWICFKQPDLDPYETPGPFGEVLTGLEVIKKIKENYGSSFRSSLVLVSNCGVC